jgi:hypothetical protein
MSVEHLWIDTDLGGGGETDVFRHRPVPLPMCLDCVGIKPRSSQREGASVGAVVRRTAVQAGRSRDGVIGVFHCLNPSGRPMNLGSSTHPITNEYQEYFVGGKGGRCVGLTTFMCRLSGNLEASASEILRVCTS